MDGSAVQVLRAAEASFNTMTSRISSLRGLLERESARQNIPTESVLLAFHGLTEKLAAAHASTQQGLMREIAANGPQDEAEGLQHTAQEDELGWEPA